MLPYVYNADLAVTDAPKNRYMSWYGLLAVSGFYPLTTTTWYGTSAIENLAMRCPTTYKETPITIRTYGMNSRFDYWKYIDPAWDASTKRIEKWKQSIVSSRISKTSTRFLVMDSNYFGVRFPVLADPNNSCLFPHPGLTTNILYLDGHAGSMSAPSITPYQVYKYPFGIVK